MGNFVLCSAMAIDHGAEPPVWLHLLPAGEAHTSDGRGPYRVIDPRSLIAASMSGGKLVLDENHATDLAAPKGLPAPACGWIVQLRERADGVWGRVEWTETAKRAEAWRGYRGVSPVIFHRKDGTVLKIARASLTNTPNLTGLTALHHSEKKMGLNKETDLRTKIVAVLDKHYLDDRAKVNLVRELLKEDDEAAFQSIGVVCNEAKELALQASIYQRDMAEAGVAIDFATAVHRVRDGTARQGR